MSKKMTQAEMVLDMLRERPLSQFDALRELGCMRLASRISDLRKAGHIISSNNKSHVNKYGRKINYVVYNLVKEAESNGD